MAGEGNTKNSLDYGEQGKKRDRNAVSAKQQAAGWQARAEQQADILSALFGITDRVIQPGDSDFILVDYLKKQAVRLGVKINTAS